MSEPVARWRVARQSLRQWLFASLAWLPWLLLAWAPVLTAPDPPAALAQFDFRTYYTIGRMILGGDAARINDLATQFAWQRAIWPEVSRPDQFLPFHSPAFAALPTALAAFGSATTGYLIWTTLHLLLAIVLLNQVWCELRPLGSQSRRLGIMLLVARFPALAALMQGQWSFLLTLALLSSWQAFRAEAPFRAGLWLTALCLKPHLAVLPALLLVWRREWRALAGWGVGAAVCLAVWVGLTGVDGLALFARSAAEAVSGAAPGVQLANQNTWRALVGLALPRGALETGVWLVGAAAITGLGAWVWRDVAWGSPRAAVAWSTLVLAISLTSPHLFAHDLVLLTLPSLWLAVAGPTLALSSRQRRWLGWEPLATTTLLWIAAVAFAGQTAVVTVPYLLTWLGALGWLAHREAAAAETAPSTPSEPVS